MALGSMVMVHVVGDGSAIELLQQLGREDLPRDAETRVAARQTQHIGGVVIHDAQIVRDKQNGQPAFVTKTVECVVEAVLPRFVHARGGLVQQQDRRMSYESCRNQQPLKLAARERSDGLPTDSALSPTSSKTLATSAWDARATTAFACRKSPP